LAQLLGGRAGLEAGVRWIRPEFFEEPGGRGDLIVGVNPDGPAVSFPLDLVFDPCT
jgi:hypothetical protein